MTIINYTRGGREFVHKIRARKITDDGREYYLTESCEVRGTAITNAICARARLPSLRPPWYEELLLVVLRLEVCLTAEEQIPSRGRGCKIE